MTGITDSNGTASVMAWSALKLPARIDAAQTARVLGTAEHDMPVLVASGLLKPLGDPAQNATKYFSSLEIVELSLNRAWLDKATKRISQYWLNKRSKGNAKRIERQVTAQSGTAPAIRP